MTHFEPDTVALISGGGSGIGRGIAEAFAQAGAAVAIAGRHRAPLDETVRAIEGTGGKVHAVVGDLARHDDAERVVEETVRSFGTLHLLVNNAGISRGGDVTEMSPEDIDGVIDTDLRGPIYLTRAALPYLRTHRDAGTAAIVNISSSVTQRPIKSYSVYSAAKAGLDMLTRCWALDFAQDRIRVNAISPGIVETPIFETMMPSDAIPGFLADLAEATPLGRVGKPEDVARLALFLASPRSDWITGAVIPLDGGLGLGSGE